MFQMRMREKQREKRKEREKQKGKMQRVVMERRGGKEDERVRRKET
jgi:hypothetical protein